MNNASSTRFRQTDIMMVMALVAILGVMVIPVPTLMLDIFLVLSLGISILILFFILEIKQPVDFSAFPSVLLLITLFRLALNVATTRQILLNAFGGNVIEAFGNFVVGGNYAVGIVVFLILSVINFKVITAGSGRIAEVAARFTLDAMPGKQMSIDADLNQGLIDDKEATRRRDLLRREADFYGAMDGASKFVRGDAVAGLIITTINIVAGLFIGTLQKGMTVAEAAGRFTLLSIGDGLVQQLPALIISTAAGILVTRAAAEENLASEISSQLFMRPKQLIATSAVLLAIALVPGMPSIPLIAMSSIFGGMAYVIRNRPPKTEKNAAEQPVEAAKGMSKRVADGRRKQEALPSQVAAMKNVLAVSPVDIEIGFGLVSLVDRNQGGKLIERIGNVRAQIAEELGLVLPPVNVRDNVNLRNNDYSILIRGIPVAGGSIRPGHLMAIDPSGAVKLEGYQAVKEPAFNFNAFWIPESARDMAESKTLTVVDCANVITTHLAEVVRRNAADILTRQDVSDLLDQLKESSPAVVQELIPNKLTVGGVHRVLQALLRERVSVRDMAVIVETLADYASRTQDTTLLTEYCRRALGAHITRSRTHGEDTIRAVGLHPDAEAMIKKACQREGGGAGAPLLSPSQARDFVVRITDLVQAAKSKGLDPVILCSPSIRPHVRQLTAHAIRDTAVLSFAEVPDSLQVEMIDLVPAPQAAETEAMAEGVA